VATFFYTFKQGGWETIETMWYVGKNPPNRQICVTGNHKLRVLVAFFPLRESTDGCITYGGIFAAAVHRVQAYGQRGETIQVSQAVAPA
jgi:hypothetical protein